MKFLFNAVQQAFGPKETLIARLQANLGKKYPARSHKTLHASDVTYDQFCARELALLEITKTQRKPEHIDTALKVTFDVGNAVSDLARENWLGEQTVGGWHCPLCGVTTEFTKKPEPKMIGSDHVHDWRYREVVFRAHGISGSIDCFVDLGAPKLTLVELKIMAPDQFAELAGPLAEHRIRTALYLKLVADSDSAHKAKVNTEVGKVLYVSRAYGKKHHVYGAILPFKEFDVPRDDEALKPVLDRAARVQLFREKGVIPAREVCTNSWSGAAKTCDVCGPCFSGKFP